MELDVWTIVSAILAVLAGLFTAFWSKAKGKVALAYKLLRECLDVVDAATAALEDDKITKEEVEKIKKEAGEVKVAWQALLRKE